MGGIKTPIHLSGHCSSPRREADECRKTSCRCGSVVFFVRYNGGCVWLDDLGHPWPRHECRFVKAFRGELPLPACWPRDVKVEIGTVVESAFRREYAVTVTSIRLADAADQRSLLHLAMKDRQSTVGLVAISRINRKLWSAGEELSYEAEWRACQQCKVTYPANDIAQHEARHRVAAAHI